MPHPCVVIRHRSLLCGCCRYLVDSIGYAQPALAYCLRDDCLDVPGNCLSTIVFKGGTRMIISTSALNQVIIGHEPR